MTTGETGYNVPYKSLHTCPYVSYTWELVLHKHEMFLQQNQASLLNYSEFDSVKTYTRYMTKVDKTFHDCLD